MTAPNQDEARPATIRRGGSMATLRDVAARAGVSASAVSYILRGDTRFHAETVERVRAAARELGYTANLSARILKAGRNGVIGVAVYALEAAQPMRLAAAITRQAGERGLRVIVQETANSREGELQTLERTTSQFCDGLIFSPAKVSAEEIKSHIGTKPMVWCEDFSDEPLFDAVVTPSFTGARDAVRHLIAAGCRRIGILGIGVRADAPGEARSVVFAKDGNSAFRTQRLHGALAALDEAGITFEPGLAIDCSWDFEEARKAAHRLVAQRADTDGGLPVDGLFCLNDVMAMGAARGFADCGVRVPADVAIIGFDGIRETAYTSPSISTIAIDYDDYARKALDLLISRIDHPGDEDGSPTPRRLVADYRIVQRESTAR
ncbi:LacI family DNA-binding transcriptional regulator [Bifidobacterium simiiventris]|uniref:LacI family DNA-binding transcriptional regulator n=1 Tax=Bifidobacterium simiiventris TaxID=2834434 RepID=UPI001C56BAE8|nr:LacI family DNA-binding transcriptional regulator [Bifidobacterium simiiventris]MBW3079412.1 LacI family DNA-binding transcriptional regulator [Bifidobacterium simiiventris]